MIDIDQVLEGLTQSLVQSIDVGSALTRNPIAYKWKAPYRCFVLRECVHWRTTDLLKQAHSLSKNGHILGARILLRSAIETVAVLVYLSQQMDHVVQGKSEFHDFSDKTAVLISGSRNKSTPHVAINILTVLQKCDDSYPGILAAYETLSESAHPNFEGLCFGYTRVDFEEHANKFSNNWASMSGDRHPLLMELLCGILVHEYNTVWPARLEELESWIVSSDDLLEATKRSTDTEE